MPVEPEGTYEEPEGTYDGHSEFGWSIAAHDAVKKYEKENGVPGPDDPPVTLRVVEMTVTFENPIRDYSVTLG
jgi:hypothetical protein